MGGLGRAWLFTTTRRVCIDSLRKEARMETMEEGGGVPPESAVQGSESAPDEQLMSAERQHRLAGAVERLPANQREAVRLRFESGLSYAEIALTLGSTEGTVAWWLHAAVKTLRSALGDAFGEGTVASSIGGGEA